MSNAKKPVTMETIKARLRSLGYTPSGGSWEDASRIFVFSTESAGPATYGAAAVGLEYRKESGKLYRNNSEIAVS